MGTDDRILAVDLGTSGVKVALTGVGGELVASAVERYPLHVLGDGGTWQQFMTSHYRRTT